MLKLAKDALLSFSFKPLKLAAGTGIFLVCASIIYLIVALILGICGVLGTVGLMFVVLAVALLFQGITLITIGIQNEYMARMYDEARARPLYLIRDRVNFSD
jgi:dolichol-phosphate mannosyltransferase